MTLCQKFSIAFLLAAPLAQAEQYPSEPRWWKGNTHTHSWWSDGDTPPEVIADWYKDRGYNFLVFSDHNMMQEGEKWYAIERDATRKALETYREMFGDDWVEEREQDGVTKVKLKTLNEFSSLFHEAGDFIFISGEEISDRFRSHPIHLNGINLVRRIDPQGGHSVSTVMQNNLNAVREQSKAFGQPMLVHLNHPNFHYAVQPEDFFYLNHKPGEGFFEMYNGHPGVDNDGDELHPSAERTWDIVLAKRLGELNRSLIYGMATDDAHEYTAWGEGETNPGRGWVMVRSRWLTPNEITAAMQRGDFYNSTGVELQQLKISDNVIDLEVAPEPGVKYTVEFVGTLRDADLGAKREEKPHKHRENAEHYHQHVYQYSSDIGKVLKRVKGTRAQYRASGDEIYVRARVVSDKPHPNPYKQGDTEMAWTQPLVVTP